MACLPDSARAQEDAGPGQDLYLEVFVNGQPRNLITRFTDLGNGVLTADADDLRESGILAGPDASGEVRLDQIPGLGWRLIEPDQTIRFIVMDEVMAPYELSAGAAAPSAGHADAGEAEAESSGPPVDHGYGLVLNYGLNVEAWRPSAQAGSGAAGRNEHNVSGSFDARLFMPLGALTHSFAITPGPDRSHQYRRLDSSWRSAFPGRALQLQIGDLATRGPGWARPVRMGGVMLERSFALRPDIVTMPLAGFEGRAELPSTVEVFSGAIRAYSTDVPAGPFSIRDLPLTTGAGVAQVVVTDVTGQERRIDLPFLVSAELLRPGLSDFALAAGRPRLGIGTDSDRYGDTVFGVATLRYGINDRMTLTAHAEGGRGLAMAGSGLTFRMAELGTTSINLAHSRAARGNGSLMDMSTSLTWGGTWGSARMSARVMRSWDSFTDVAAMSAVPTGGALNIAEFPKQIAQLSIAMPLGNNIGGGASIFLSDIVPHDGTQSETSIGASYSRALWRGSSLTVSASSLRGAHRDTVVGMHLNLPLGARGDAGLVTERRRDGWRSQAHASGRSEQRLPGWSWRVQADRGRSQALRGTGVLDRQSGRAEIAARTSPDGEALGLRLQGSVVASGGGVFVSRQIRDAFVVVDAGAAGVSVSAENRPVGRTGRSGRILVPDLRAYEDNRISIDPLSLPLDAAIGSTQQIVRPAHHSGARVDFGVETNAREALVELLAGPGRPLEVGGRVVLNGSEDDFLVGFDGETFLSGLQDRNSVEVFYPDGRSCRAQFDYADQPGTLTELRGVPCT